MSSDAAHWHEFNQKVLQSLDLILEYQSFGVKLTKTTPSASGTVPCYGFLRSSDNPDKNASAYINVNNGRYTDKPNGDSLSFWDFCVAINKFPTWTEARAHYASKVGLGKKLPKKEQFGDRPKDKVAPYKYTQPHHFNHFLQRYKGITVEGITLAGGLVGKYPLKSANPRLVIYWYAYGPQLLSADPAAVAVMPLDGGKLAIYQGENAPPRQEPKAVFCGTGLIGRHALNHWDEADVIYKVEGLTDLCALQSIIPPEKRNTHLVITNACGAGEFEIVQSCRHLFKDKQVVIIGDADQAGQDGAGIWLQQLSPVASSVTNVQLPYELAPKKGKDLRDFIVQTSGSWYEFQKLCGNAEPITAEETKKLKSPDQVMLEGMGIEVIGEVEGQHSTKIFIFSQELGKRSEIQQINKVTRAALIQKVGPHIREYIMQSKDEIQDGKKVHLWQVKEAIAAVASVTPLSVDQVIGPGCWEIDGLIYLIGNRDVAIWDGQTLEVSKTHSVKGKLIEHSQEPWCSYKQLNSFLKESLSQEWCISAVEEANNLFRKWTNWKHYRNAEITTALVACSWLQTVWKWRPVVAVTGPSNCGKSTLVVDCLPQMFGDLSLDFESTPTEAGIRNLLRCSAKVLILDEFENTKQKGGQKRRDSIVQDIFRTTTRGGKTARGTADQKGMMFGLRHIPWTAAISIKMDDAADRSRYVILEMNSQKGNSSSLTLPPSEDLHRLGVQLLAVALRHWERIVDLHAWLKLQPVDGYYQRIVESYGLIAGFFGAVYGLTNQETLQVLLDYLQHRDFADQSEYQHQEFLRDIVTQEVFLPRGERRLIGELLRGSVDVPDKDATEILGRAGLKRLKGPHGSSLFFAHELVAKNLLRGETRGNDVRQVFKHCEEAKESKQRVGGHNARGFMISEDVFWEMIGGDGNDQSSPGSLAATGGSNGSAGGNGVF